MAAELYYILSLLPPLPNIGDQPPITLQEVVRLAQDLPEPQIQTIIDIIRLETTLQAMIHRSLKQPLPPDLIMGDSISEIKTNEVLRIAQVLAEMFSDDQTAQPEDIWLTQLWDTFFREVARLGNTVRCHLLTTWSNWERSLRWQLAFARQKVQIHVREQAQAQQQSLTQAQIQGAKISESQVTTQSASVISSTAVSKCAPIQISEDMHSELDSEHIFDHSQLIQDACLAQDPLAAERILDEGRIRFLDEQACRYSFQIEELLAYILKLRLLLRHARLNRTEGIHILEEVTSI